jgi:hypothetical protein
MPLESQSYRETLTEEETAALARLLTNTIDADRYPLAAHSTLEGDTCQDPA